jgi:hypothetical protein
MATVCYALRPGYDSMYDIGNALQARYGGDVTIHYVGGSGTSRCVIFSCPAISNKVIKFSPYYLTWERGDAYVSGRNISNPETLNADGNDYGLTNAFLLAGDDFILFAASGYRQQVTIIGTLTNGHKISGGWGAQQVGYSKDTTINEPVMPAYMWPSNQRFQSPDGKIYAQPILFHIGVQKSLLVNANGTPASLPGIFQANCPMPVDRTPGANHLIVPMSGSWYGLSSMTSAVPLYVPFDSIVDMGLS